MVVGRRTLRIALSALLPAGCSAPSGPGPGESRTVDAAPAPAQPITLFDGTDRDAWTHLHGQPCTWPVLEGQLIVEPGSGSIRTRDTWQDFTLDLEFYVPEFTGEIVGQARGNSGVYLHNRYEVQILDSYGQRPADRTGGALYGFRAPDVNACGPPCTWQRYHIDFTAPRWDGKGTKTADARVTVIHNDVRIHDDVAIPGPTGRGEPEAPGGGPVVLQDHGSRVRFRNIVLQPRGP